MTFDHRLRATALGAVLFLGTAGAALAPLPDLGPSVAVTQLPSGSVAIVRPAAGAPVAAIELWFRAPSTGFGTPQPSVAWVSAQAVAASKPLAGMPLGGYIRSLGGRLDVTAYSDSVNVTAIVPSIHAADVVKALTTAYFSPILTADGFQTAVREIRQQAIFTSFDVETVVRDAVFAQLFTSGPQHYPALGDPESLGRLTEGDARSFATRAFRAQNAFLVSSGDIAPAVVASASGGRGDGSPNRESAAANALAAAPAPFVGSFVEPSGGLGWAGPAIASEREATAMDFLADYMFRPETGVVWKQAIASDPQALLVGQFVTLHDPGVLFVAYSSRHTAAVASLVRDGIAALRKPMARVAFDAARGAFEYHLLSDLQTPVAKADNFGWYAVEGAPAYAPGVEGVRNSYFDAAATLTPDFVASIATKYLGKPPVVVTLEPSSKAPR